MIWSRSSRESDLTIRPSLLAPLEKRQRAVLFSELLSPLQVAAALNALLGWYKMTEPPSSTLLDHLA